MNGPTRSGHLTYYEQLGVPSNASAEEIRDAYRALARMLHPDQQTDPHLKQIAEQQMRKLNPIYTVLSDAMRRRQYDEDLAEEFSPAVAMSTPRPVGESRILGRFVWSGAILVAAGLLYWLAAGNSGLPFSSDQVESRPTIPIFIPQTKVAGPPPNENAEIAQLQSEVKTLTAERDFAVHELTRLKGAPAPEPPAPAPPQPASADHRSIPKSNPRLNPVSSAALTELPASQPPAPHPDALIPPRPPGKSTLAGFWFYAPPTKPEKGQSQPLYKPDFIEATIVEQDGVVKGKYRSRLQVTDRAANPEVVFTFTGRPNGMTLTCPWVGLGGARGEVTMKMTSDNSMRLDWAASEMGSQLAMASGTAILTRRVD
jgi:hypothetical protein